MKLAMVSALWGPAYPTGSGIYAYELSKKFAQHGYDVHAYTSDIGNFDGTGYQNFHLHRKRSHGLALNFNPLSQAFVELVSNDYDIVHAHSYVFFMSNSVALARAFRDFKYVLSVHGGFDYQKIPNGICSKRFWLKDTIYDKTIGLSTIQMADKVLSVCKKDIPIIENNFGVEAEHVPNAVSTDDFNYAEGDSKDVVYVGKLESWKGAEDLVKIFKIIHKRHPDVNFKVAGDGSLFNALKYSNLPIKMMGFITHDKIPQIYHSSGVSILPSYMEGSPTTCMEASSCGIPVVATDVGDTNEIVRDGKSGYIHSPGDVYGIANSVIQLLEDDSLRRQMGKFGRNHIVDNYSYEVVFQKTFKIYESLIGEIFKKDVQDARAYYNVKKEKGALNFKKG